MNGRRPVMYTRTGGPDHSGVERYSVEFKLAGEDIETGLYDVKAERRRFVIRPSKVILVWERPLGGEWLPKKSWRGGSCIRGQRVGRSGQTGEQTGGVEVWLSTEHRRLTDYAYSLPGLEALVAEVVGQLPR